MPHCSSEHDEQFESMVGGASLSAAEDTEMTNAESKVEDYHNDVLAEEINGKTQVEVVQDEDDQLKFDVEFRVGTSGPVGLVSRESEDYKEAVKLVKSAVERDAITKLRELSWSHFIHVMKLGFHSADSKWRRDARNENEYKSTVLKHQPEGFVPVKNPLIQEGVDGDTGVDVLDKMTVNVMKTGGSMPIDDVEWTQNNLKINGNDGIEHIFDFDDIKHYFKRFYLGNISNFIKEKGSSYTNIVFGTITNFNLDELFRSLRIWVNAFFTVYKKEIYGTLINRYINSLDIEGFKNPIYKLLILKIVLKFCIKKSVKFMNKLNNRVNIAYCFYAIYNNIFSYTIKKINHTISLSINNSAQGIIANVPTKEEKNQMIERLLEGTTETIDGRIDDDLRDSITETIGELGTGQGGGALKRITKKHTKKGKSKKHLKKGKKGKKTGKKVRFHSASKKSKKNTRKRH